MLDTNAAGAQPVEAPVTGTPEATPPPAEGSRESMVALASKLLSAPDVGDEPLAETGDEAPAKPRDPTGKFAKAADASGETEAPAADADAKPDDAAAKEPPKPVREVPAHWRMTEGQKAKWAEAPPEVQDAVAQMAARDRQTLSRLGNDLRPFREIEQQHANYFRELGSAPPQVFANFIAWDRAMKADPEKVVPQFLKLYGLDVSRLASGNDQPAADPSGLPPDPEVVQLRETTRALQEKIAALERQTGQVTSHLTAQQQADQERQAAAETARLNDFASKVREFAAKHSDFQTLVDSGDLEIEIDVLRARGVPEDQLLEKAYDRAVHANAATREARSKQQSQLAEKAKAEAARKAADAAKRAGAINVRGAPENTAPPANVRDAQHAVLRKHGLI